MKNVKIITTLLATLVVSGCAMNGWKKTATPMYEGERKPLNQVAHIQLASVLRLGDSFAQQMASGIVEVVAEIDSINGRDVPPNTSVLEVLPGEYEFTATCHISKMVKNPGDVLSTRAIVPGSQRFMSGTETLAAGETLALKPKTALTMGGTVCGAAY